MAENDKSQTPPPEKQEKRPMAQVSREPEVKKNPIGVFESAANSDSAKK